LVNYRIVHFATHGFLAGQLDGTHEPGLILTPPDKANEEEDGYLSASKIASLKLDTDGHSVGLPATSSWFSLFIRLESCKKLPQAPIIGGAEN
jgi:hypothetical protein